MSRLSCGIQCVRFLLFVLNMSFVCIGLTLLAFGIYVKVSKSIDIALSDHISLQINEKNTLDILGIIMIVVAVFIVLVSIFGCMGAASKNRGLLYIYVLILGLLVILELTALIIALRYRVNIRDSYKSALEGLFTEIYSNNHTELQHTFEEIEREFKCCGVNNVTDYYHNHFHVPSTCYHDEDFHKSIYDQGCADAVIQWFWNQIPIIGGILGSILLIEIFAIIAAISLGIAIAHSSYSELYD